MHSTGDLGCERAPRDVFVVKFDHDVVIPTGGREVGHRARPIFVVLTGDVGLGRPLDGQRQPTCMDRRTELSQELELQRGSQGLMGPSPVSLVTMVNVASVFTVPWVSPGPKADT